MHASTCCSVLFVPIPFKLVFFWLSKEHPSVVPASNFPANPPQVSFLSQVTRLAEWHLTRVTFPAHPTNPPALGSQPVTVLVTVPKEAEFLNVPNSAKPTNPPTFQSEALTATSAIQFVKVDSVVLSFPLEVVAYPTKPPKPHKPEILPFAVQFSNVVVQLMPVIPPVLLAPVIVTSVAQFRTMHRLSSPISPPILLEPLVALTVMVPETEIFSKTPVPL